jgi:hypothetical protein
MSPEWILCGDGSNALRALLEVEPEAAEYGVGLGAAALAVEHLLVGQLEDDLNSKGC